MIKYRPIGVIRTPLKDIEGTPIQPTGGKGIKGTIKIQDEFVEGLSDLDGFSHIILIYHLHLSKKYKLKVIPFLDDKLHGVFATRAPKRPNPIGLSIVKLNKIIDNILYIENIDIVNGTPLLDIKPYINEKIDLKYVKLGWLTGKLEKFKKTKADKRFK